MPHTNKKPSRVPPPFKPAEFVNIQLSKEQQAEIRANAWSLDAFDNALNNLLGAGYKVTFRYDERNDCFAAWLVAPNGSENEGYILAGRGSTPHKAIKQACYIHFAILEGVWGADMGREKNELDD